VGDEFQLLPNRIKSHCPEGYSCSNYAYVAATTIIVSGPLNPMAPSVVFRYSARVGSCAAIKIDATETTGKGALPWKKILWNVSDSGGESVMSIYEYLVANYSNSFDIVNIPNRLLSAGSKYNISLLVENFFSKSAFAFAVVEISANPNIPSLSVYGPRSILRFQELSLEASAFLSSCEGRQPSSIGLTYSWTVYQSGLLQSSLTSVSNVPELFVLPSFSLSVNSVYKVNVTVTTSKGLSASEVHIVSVGRAKCVSVINAGSFISVHHEATRLIDGSSSYDRDFPDDKSRLRYLWSCVEESPQSGLPCPAFALASSTNDRLPFIASNFVTDKTYRIELTVNNSEVPDSADTASILVNVKAGPQFPTVTLQKPMTKYNVDERISLVANIQSSSTLTRASWSILDDSGALIPTERIATSAVQRELSFGSSEFGISIAPYSFTSGAKYTFLLTASYPSTSSSTPSYSVAKCEVVVNAAPFGGRFEISPASGVALNTSFYLLAALWSDDVSDYPLLYKFSSYQSDPLFSNLLRDALMVPYAYALLSQGLASSDFNIVGVLEVSDSLGCSITTTKVVQVLPPSDLSNAVQNAKSLLLETKSNPSGKQQVFNGLVHAMNQVNCSSAPNCASLRRFECSDTSATCGRCFDDYKFGVFGDANSMCYATKKEFKASQSGRRLAGVNQRVLLASSEKTCPNACSGNGDCVFSDFLGAQIQSCDALDLSCRASCVCDSGFFGSDCSMTQSEIAQAREGKELLCASLYTDMDEFDLTSAVMVYRSNMVSTLLKDLSEATDFAYRNCSAVIIESVATAPSIASSDAVMPFVVRSLSSVLEMGSLIPDFTYYGVVSALSLLNRYRQARLVAGEQPVQIYTRNLRYFVSLVFRGSLNSATVWNLPLSTFEEAWDANVSTVTMLGSDGLMNKTVANTASKVGVSMWEVLVNTGRGSSNSSVVQMQLRDLSNTSLASILDSVIITLYNRESIVYQASSPTVVSVACRKSNGLEPYFEYVNCEGGVQQVFCPGNVSVLRSITCPYPYEAPACVMWNGERYAPNPNCSVVSFSAVSTTCSCAGVAGAFYDASVRTSNSSLPMFSDAQIYEFSSATVMLDHSLEYVGIELLPSPEPNGSIVVLVTALGYICFFLVFPLVSLIFKASDTSKSHLSIFGSTEANIAMDFAMQLLKGDHDRPMVLVRFYQDLLSKNEYLSLFRWFSPRYIGADVFKEWLVLAGYFLHLMVVHTGLAWVVYPDSGYCDARLGEADCLSERSLLVVHPLCQWSDADLTCSLRPPTQSITEMYLLLGLACLLVVPLNFVWRLAVRRVMARYSSSSRGNAKSSSKVNINNKVVPIAIDSDEAPADSKRDDALVKSPASFDADVAAEAAYVQGAAEAFVRFSSGDSSASSARAIQRCYLRQKLSLDKQGKMHAFDPSWSRWGLGRLVASPATRLRAKLGQARTTAAAIAVQLSTLGAAGTTSDGSGDVGGGDTGVLDLQLILLVEHLLVFALPEALRFFAHKLFLPPNPSYDSSSLDGTGGALAVGFALLLRMMPVMLFLYVCACLGFVVAFGLLWYGQATTLTWVLLVALSAAFEGLVVRPVHLFFRRVVMPDLFLSELRRTHRHLLSRYGSIVNRMLLAYSGAGKNSGESANNDTPTTVVSTAPTETSSLELIQHFNPACRAVRLAVSAGPEASTSPVSPVPSSPAVENLRGVQRSALARSLLYITDEDLRFLREHDDSGYGDDEDTQTNAISTLLALAKRLVYAGYTAVYHCTPDALIDLVFDGTNAVLCVFLLLGFYCLALLSPALPVAVVVVCVLVAVLHEMLTMRRVRELQRQEAGALDAEVQVQMRAQEEGVKSNSMSKDGLDDPAPFPVSAKSIAAAGAALGTYAGNVFGVWSSADVSRIRRRLLHSDDLPVIDHADAPIEEPLATEKEKDAEEVKVKVDEEDTVPEPVMVEKPVPAPVPATAATVPISVTPVVDDAEVDDGTASEEEDEAPPEPTAPPSPLPHIPDLATLRAKPSPVSLPPLDHTAIRSRVSAFQVVNTMAKVAKVQISPQDYKVLTTAVAIYLKNIVSTALIWFDRV
jgi:hypothetical protein